MFDLLLVLAKTTRRARQRFVAAARTSLLHSLVFAFEHSPT
jgi:hypothetical protein